MTKREKIIYRSFAYLNYAFVLSGAFFLFSSFLNVGSVFEGEPWESNLFYCAYSFVNCVFLYFLYKSSSLLRNFKEKGFFVLKAVLKCEIAYYFLMSFLWFLPSPFNEYAAGATGIGNMGLGPQIITLYPIVGLVFITLFRRLRWLAI